MTNFLKGLFTKKSSQKNEKIIQFKPDQSNGKHACYVLITCGEPSADGNMQVEMTYEGDRVLASYLIESAQGLLEDQLDP
ncbi:MAG: hypothetical protein S4CHLAM37_09340 [Chlamydiia bacterium]|nr:hypothetical protein [Chlamydiia bacterium]